MRMVNVKAIETFVLGLVAGAISMKIYICTKAKEKSNCKSEDHN